MRDKLIAKALKDPKFREALKKDPAAAVEKELGIKVPKGLKIRIVEDSADTVHLVLPPAAQSGRLNEDQLGSVSGGTAACRTGNTQGNVPVAPKGSTPVSGPQPAPSSGPFVPPSCASMTTN